MKNKNNIGLSDYAYHGLERAAIMAACIAVGDYFYGFEAMALIICPSIIMLFVLQTFVYAVLTYITLTVNVMKRFSVTNTLTPYIGWTIWRSNLSINAVAFMTAGVGHYSVSQPVEFEDLKQITWLAFLIISHYLPLHVTLEIWIKNKQNEQKIEGEK